MGVEPNHTTATAKEPGPLYHLKLSGTDTQLHSHSNIPPRPPVLTDDDTYTESFTDNFIVRVSFFSTPDRWGERSL
jgi:hypothetical protein